MLHKYEGTHVSVTKCMSHFSIFLPTKATVKLSNKNKGLSQIIVIIWWDFTKCPIIYPVVLVNHFPYNPSNDISLGPLKYYVGFHKGYIWTYWTVLFCLPARLFLDIILLYSKQFRLSSNIYVQIQPPKKQEYCGTNGLCPINTESFSAYSSAFWLCLDFPAKKNGKKKTNEGSPNKYPWLGRSIPYFILTEANKIPRGYNIDVSNVSSGFIFQMDFSFLNVEIIHGFTSNFVAICSATSQPFGFTPRSKGTPLYIIKLLFFELSISILICISSIWSPHMSPLGFMCGDDTTSSFSWSSRFSWYLLSLSPNTSTLESLSGYISIHKSDTGSYAHLLSEAYAW